MTNNCIENKNIDIIILFVWISIKEYSLRYNNEVSRNPF